MALTSLDAMPGNYNLSTAKSRLNTALGWNLTDADTTEAFQKFGGNPASTGNDWSDASLKPVYDYFNTRGQKAAPSPQPTPAPEPGATPAPTPTPPPVDYGPPPVAPPAPAPMPDPAPGPAPISPTTQPSISGIPAAAPAPLPAPVDPRLSALYDELDRRAKQSLAISPDDPTIKASTDAAYVSGQRALLRNEQEAAERGGPYATGALENNARMGAEALGSSMAGLTATLMTNELQARRAEIAQALNGQFGILSQVDQDRLRQEDQALTIRQQDIGREHTLTSDALAGKQLTQSAQQQAWMQAFQEKGFTADEAARLWQEMFNQQAQDIGQSNTVWDQNWKLSGGA